MRQVRTAGLPVEVEVTGLPIEPLPAGLDLSAYRIVQEALTNALDHAGRAPAQVARPLRETGSLEISVRNESGRSESAGDARIGHGLIGMRERSRSTAAA